MALRVAQRARILSRHRYNGLLTTITRANSDIRMDQSYYHPKDVPAYQTPAFESGDYEGKEIDESLWTRDKTRTHNINFRAKLKADYVFEGQDHPTWIFRQRPELFLPDEPTFFEFWGPYPFAFFGMATLMSKEYWLSFHSFPTHASWTILPIMVVMIASASDYLIRLSMPRAQFRHDRDWLGLTTLKNALDGLIGSYENDLKANERSVKYDQYLKALNAQKVAFYAHKRKKEFALDMLNRLKLVKQAELTYEQNLKKDLMKGALEAVEKKILTGTKIKKKWNADMFELIATVQAGGKEKPVTLPAKLFKEYIDEKSKLMEANADKPVPLDDSSKGFSDSVAKQLTTLRVYSGPKEPATEIIPRMTGAFGPLTAEQKKTLPTKAAVKKEKLRVIQEQLDRFQSDKQPKALLDRKAAC